MLVFSVLGIGFEITMPLFWLLQSKVWDLYADWFVLFRKCTQMGLFCGVFSRLHKGNFWEESWRETMLRVQRNISINTSGNR